MNNNLNDVVENVCYFLWSRDDAGLRVLANSLDELIMDSKKDLPGLESRKTVSDLIWHTAQGSIERSIRDATRDYFYFEQNEP
jgi:hypothetical protein